MAAIKVTEDYCSFETAKLLKEKGFNYPCRAVYSPKGTVRHYLKEEVSAHNLKGHKKLCPTLQMAMRWLREVHNIDICAFPYQADYILYSYKVKIYKDKEIYLTITDSKTYEESVEAALKYCLKILI